MKELVIFAHGFNSLGSFLSCEYGETEQLPVAALLCSSSCCVDVAEFYS